MASSDWPVEINENTDLSTLTNAQFNELNQIFLNETFPTDDRPLIQSITSITALRAEYENSGSESNFVKQIDLLREKGFERIRRTRGDGDCFYRSVAFGYVSSILNSKQPQLASASSLSILESTFPLLEQAGFQRLVFEDFYDVFVGLVKLNQPEEELLKAFQTPETSNSIVVFLRLLTSAQIRGDSESYAPFLLHPDFAIPMEPREFCEAFVEATGKEADHPQITALAKALRINFDIAYLDGRSGTNVDFVQFRGREDDDVDGEEERLTLLYRPGHYDILDR